MMKKQHICIFIIATIIVAMPFSFFAFGEDGIQKKTNPAQQKEEKVIISRDISAPSPEESGSNFMDEKSIKQENHRQISRLREQEILKQKKRTLQKKQQPNLSHEKFLLNPLLKEDVSELKRRGLWQKVRHQYKIDPIQSAQIHSLTGFLATVTEAEPNDDYTTANPMVYGDIVENATIDPAEDKDYFSFEGTAGDIITIEVLAKRLDPPSELDSYIFLYDTDGVTEIAQNDDYYGQDSYLLNFELPSTGTFFIKVEDWANVSGYASEGGENYFYNLTLSVGETPTYTISGNVVRQDNGAPIGPSGVWLINGNYPYTQLILVNTNTDGTYEISGVPAGEYFVRANGWVEVNPDDWQQLYIPEWFEEAQDRNSATLIEVNTNVENINFTLEEGGYISGTVIDADDNPIEGAWVECYNFDNDNYIKGTNTDADGFFRLTALYSGDYKVRASGQGFIAEYFDNHLRMEDADRVTVTAPNETENINFSLVTGGSIAGVITDEFGNPFEGIWVWADFYEGEFASSAQTNADGSYELFGLGTGDYRVGTTAEGYAMKWYSDTYFWDDAIPVSVNAPDRTEGINFELSPSGTITGRITDESDNPITNFWIDWCFVDRDYWGLGSWYSYADGYYEIRDLPAGDYKIQAHADGYINEFFDDKIYFEDADIVTVAASGTIGDINFRLGQGGSISGVVLDEGGNPIEGAWMWANEWDGGFGNGTVSQSDGTYLITGLQEGTYRVQAEAPGYVRELFDNTMFWEDATPVDVIYGIETGSINFSLEVGGSISGRVTDESGNPLNNIWWDVYNIDLNRWGLGFIHDINNGYYTLEGLPAGNYNLWTGSENYIGEWFDGVILQQDATAIQVPAPGNVDNINFELGQGGFISGTVLDEFGNPIPYLNVTANLYDDGYGRGTSTRYDGTYTIGGLVSGDYRVEAWKEGYQRQFFDHVQSWEDANRVTVDAPNETGDINFDLVELPDNAIAISNVWVDDDELNESWGNGDGQLNPGEFVEIRFDVTNTSAMRLEGVWGVPDHEYDVYFHPNMCYFLDDNLWVGSIDPGASFTVDDIDCYIASDTPEGHVITIPIAFYDQENNPVGNDTIRIPVTGTDIIPPRFTDTFADPYYVPSGEIVTISVFVQEASTPHDVTAFLESPDENVLATLPMFDDGTHGDEFPDDRRYACQWSPTIEANFWIDFSAVDDYSNTGEADNMAEFTSEPPPEPSADILLVVDNPYSAFMHYYTDALDSKGLGYDIWESRIYGVVPEEYIRHYQNGVVIWYCAHEFPTLSEEERNVLSYYLNRGGNLFITEQDIGWDLNDRQGDPAAAEWYSAYLYANYVADESGSRYLTGIDGDLISDGLAFSIEGGDGANNQGWPSEISPIAPARSIFCYDGAESQSKFFVDAKAKPKTNHFEIVTLVPGKTGKDRWQVIDKFTTSNPLVKTEDDPPCRSGAICVDNGVYKLVYFAFGFEAIANGDDRADVMERVVRWLQRVHISGTVAYSATERPVSEAGIDLVHIEAATTTSTDEAGEYYFGEILRGEVEMTPHKQGDPRDAITLSDPLMALYYRAGMLSLTEEQILAADVNEDDAVTLYDVNDMLRYIAFLPVKHNGKVGEWRFAPGNIIFNAHRNYNDINFTAFLLGDVSQNWGIPVASKSAVAEAELILQPPQRGNLDEVTIPIFLDRKTSVIQTLAFTLEYDSTLLAFKSFSSATMTRNFVSVVNGESAGKVYFAMAGIEGLTESGQLFFIHFEVKEQAKAAQTNFSLTQALLNDSPSAAATSISINLEELKLGTPATFKLADNYPNPFNPETTIEYQLPEPARVTIQIYDILGQVVKTLVDESQKAGYYRVIWDGRNKNNAQAASGVYFYMLKSEKFSAMKKMVLIR